MSSNFVHACCRTPLFDVVNQVVKRGVIEELCRLLLLVADEEADKVMRHKDTTKVAPAGSESGGEGVNTDAILGMCDGTWRTVWEKSFKIRAIGVFRENMLH